MHTLLAQSNTSQDVATEPGAVIDPETGEAANRTIDLWGEAHHAFGTIVDIFSRGDTLAQPGQLIPELAELGTLWALIFVILGVTCLLNGYKFHRAMTIAIVVLLGAMLGYWMGGEINGPPFVVAGCVATLMAVLALPLMKYAVAVLGGLSGAFIGSNLWAGLGTVLEKSAAEKQAAITAAQEAGEPSPGGETLIQISQYIPAESFWIGALIGLVLCGLAAFLLSKITIHLFTTVSGSTIAVLGVIALLLSIDGADATVKEELSRSALVLPLLVFVPAAIGFMLQEKNSHLAESEEG